MRAVEMTDKTNDYPIDDAETAPDTNKTDIDLVDRPGPSHALQAEWEAAIAANTDHPDEVLEPPDNPKRPTASDKPTPGTDTAGPEQTTNGGGDQPPRRPPTDFAEPPEQEPEKPEGGDAAPIADAAEETSDIPSGEILLQNFTPGPDSIREQLSQDAYSQGLGVFATEDIPIAGSTGRDYAQKTTTLIVDRIKHLDEAEAKTAESPNQSAAENVHHIAEIGAGSGLLSLNILDELKTHHPEVYAKTIVHVTEGSAESVDKLKETGLFDAHEGHAVIEQMDAMQPQFSKDVAPTVIYHTYLGDSLPSRYIAVKDGEAYERQIRTTIPENARIIDGTGKEPQVLDAPQIKDIVQHDPERRVKLGPKILKVIKEDWREVPLHQTDLSPAEKERMQGYADRVEAENAQFTYSQGLEQNLEACVAGVREGGLVLVGDFGFSGTTDLQEDPRTTFGTVSASPVSFFTLGHLGNDLHVLLSTTDAPEGGPRQILLDTLHREDPAASDATKETLRATFSLPSQRRLVDGFLETVQFNLQHSRHPDVLAHNLQQAYARLPETLKVDLQLTNNTASFLVAAGYPKSALPFARVAAGGGPHVAASAYRTIARAHMALGTDHPPELEESLETAERIAPRDDRNHWLRMEYSSSIGDVMNLIAATNKFVRDARNGNELRALRWTAQNLKALGEVEHADAFMRQAERLARTAGKHRLNPDEWLAATTPL